MKKMVMLAAAVMFALGLSVGATQAATAPKEPVKVTDYGKKAPVMFNHAKHAEVKCEQCHHTKNNPKGIHKCGECHGKTKNAKTGALSLKDAAHKRDVGACWSCHRASGAKKKLKCNDCHKK